MNTRTESDNNIENYTYAELLSMRNSPMSAPFPPSEVKAEIARRLFPNEEKKQPSIKQKMLLIHKLLLVAAEIADELDREDIGGIRYFNLQCDIEQLIFDHVLKLREGGESVSDSELENFKKLFLL